MPEGELAGSRSERFFAAGRRARAREPPRRGSCRRKRDAHLVNSAWEWISSLVSSARPLRESTTFSSALAISAQFAVTSHEPRRDAAARVAKRARFPRLLSREPTKASDLPPIRLLLVRGDRLVRIPLVRSRCRSARQRCGISSARYVRKQLRPGRAAVSKCAPPGKFSRNHHPTAV